MSTSLDNLEMHRDFNILFCKIKAIHFRHSDTYLLPQVFTIWRQEEGKLGVSLKYVTGSFPKMKKQEINENPNCFLLYHFIRRKIPLQNSRRKTKVFERKTTTASQ